MAYRTVDFGHIHHEEFQKKTIIEVTQFFTKDLNRSLNGKAICEVSDSLS